MIFSTLATEGERGDPVEGRAGAKRKVYISEAAELLDRREHTLRIWEYRAMLPQHLRAHRDEREWRYWTEAQVEEIGRWLVEHDIRPGKGLKGYRPTPEQLAEHRQKMRGPRTRADG